jgi:hypothetical protein
MCGVGWLATRPFQHCARNRSTWALAEFETRRADRCRLNLAQCLFGLAAYTNTGTRCQPSARKTAPSITVQDARLHNPTQGEQLFAQVQNSRARAFAQDFPGAHTRTPTPTPTPTRPRTSDKARNASGPYPTRRCASGPYGRRSANSSACWSGWRSAGTSHGGAWPALWRIFFVKKPSVSTERIIVRVVLLCIGRASGGVVLGDEEAEFEDCWGSPRAPE